MILYHGTKFSAWEKIKEEGLIPRSQGAGSNWEHTVESDPDTIYLTDAYAFYFSLMSVNNSSTNESAVVLEIDTNKLNNKKFVADEDALEQASRLSKEGDGLPKNWGMNERTIHYRNMAPEYAKVGYGHDWSLKVLGTCGYRGKIPLSAITRVAIIDWKENKELSWTFLDPTITLMNYKIVGAKYRAYSKHIFNDSPSNEDIAFLEMMQMPFQNFERNNIVIEEVNKPSKKFTKKI